MQDGNSPHGGSEEAGPSSYGRDNSLDRGFHSKIHDESSHTFYFEPVDYLHIIIISHENIMVLLAGWDEVRRQGIRNVVTLSFDPE